MTTRSEVQGSQADLAPMAQLLRKEWLVFTPRDRGFVLGVFVLAALQTLPSDEAFFILGLALAVALTIYVPVIEWYQETDLMLLSLPVRRDTVVLARYLVAMVAGVVAGLAWTAAGRLLLPMLDAGRDTPAMWVTLSGGLTFFIAFGLLASFLLPLYFRLGVGKGALAFLGLSVVLLALSYGTAGLAGGPVPSGPVGLIPPSALISARVTAMLGSLGPAGTLTVVLVGIALVYGVSLKVSQRWFAGREF